jgi:hypothetical protein
LAPQPEKGQALIEQLTRGAVRAADHEAGFVFFAAFVVGVTVAPIYIALFALRNKKLPATGNIGYLLAEVVALAGIGKTIFKIVSLQYVHILGVDEQFCIGVGGVLTLVILLKKIIEIFSGVYKYKGNGDPQTEEN